ncbi:MAG: hypothetical protein HQL46_15560 [Gammaproteobacteria bacterium]|nr:hypothetical protein [Gammaproteobacteria bacterium]
MTVMNKQLYAALIEAGVPEDKASAAAESVADYQKDINDIKTDLLTKISILDVKLNILIVIAIIPAAKALNLW